MKIITALFVLLISAFGLLAQPDSTKPTRIDPQREALRGQGLSSTQAGELESDLARNPDDLSIRTRLLGYYFTARFSSGEAAASQLKHVLWIIKNHPENEIAGLPYCQIDAILDKKGYEEAKKLWVEQTKANSQNTAILGHAAQFFFIQDKDIAEDLLKQAQKIEPNSPHWPELLGHLFSIQPGDENAAKALEEFEKAQAVDNSEESRFARLDSLTKSAFAAGKIEKASQYANDLLQLAQKYPKDWNYGNAIHHGNSVLGRIALKKGDIAEAGQCLLRAGKTPGSPQLNSFGPDMSLAKELLEKGERDIVLQYFVLCRKFWALGGAKLDTWTKDVKASHVPDFGANLLY